MVQLIKRGCRNFKSEKLLKLKITRIKFKENNMKTTTVIKKLIISAIFVVLIIASGVEVSFAATATFTGSVDDDGGDPNLTVWFRYGQTTSYGNETARQPKIGTGEFQATVFSLQNCTTYHYQAVSKHQNFDDTMYGQNRTFTTECGNNTSPTVDIKVNNYDGPITITSNYAATLTWTSQNANSCTASGDWSGSKSISGSESTGNLTSSRTYTITCTGTGGSVSDSATIYIQQVPGIANLTVQKTVRNLTNGTGFANSTYATPSNVLMFMITLRANGNQDVQNVFVRDTFPANLIYNNQLVVARSNNAHGNYSGEITSGINLNTISAGQTVTITYQAQVAGIQNFSYGTTTLTNNVSVTSSQSGYTPISSASVIVARSSVLGASTISTGLTNNFWVDSFLLPLLIALIGIWMWRAGMFFRIEKWLDNKKKIRRTYKSEKELLTRIVTIQKTGKT